VKEGFKRGEYSKGAGGLKLRLQSWDKQYTVKKGKNRNLNRVKGREKDARTSGKRKNGILEEKTQAQCNWGWIPSGIGRRTLEGAGQAKHKEPLSSRRKIVSAYSKRVMRKMAIIIN